MGIVLYQNQEIIAPLSENAPCVGYLERQGKVYIIIVGKLKISMSWKA